MLRAFLSERDTNRHSQPSGSHRWSKGALVSEGQGRERYSVVYYSTRKSSSTPIDPHSEHAAWMQQCMEQLHGK